MLEYKGTITGSPFLNQQTVVLFEQTTGVGANIFLYVSDLISDKDQVWGRF